MEYNDPSLGRVSGELRLFRYNQENLRVTKVGT